MIRLIAALALARNSVDRAIAYGEAVPRLERLRKVAMWGLTASVVILSVSYIHLTSEMGSIRQQQKHADVERKLILHQLDVAQGDRWIIMKALLGKNGASRQTQP